MAPPVQLQELTQLQGPRPTVPLALACVSCRQRKIKCDRQSPCSNCAKHQIKCNPTTRVLQRKRRFPEWKLLDRLRKYEDILRRNNISFDPLHEGGEAFLTARSSETYGSDSEEAQESAWPTPSTTTASEPKTVWDAPFSESKESSHTTSSEGKSAIKADITRSWYQTFDSSDGLLFWSRKDPVDVSTLHPGPIQIFRIWQLYLDNVNPLLKVLHGPSVQLRVIEAASNLGNISPSFEALLFAIYCTSISSLAKDDCQAMFDLPREDLMARYQYGCQQALMNAKFLRSADREVLTALYLYLVSVNYGADPRSLSSLLAVAIRNAERMSLHSETAHSKCTVFEAEMRRRLWWSLVLFDARVSELICNMKSVLTPTWDCKIPRNVNDSDLRVKMKELPMEQGKISDSIFAVVRSALGDYVRHTAFFLKFTQPALLPIARLLPANGSVEALERQIEDRYISFCNPDDPIHFLTVWTARGILARYRLFENYTQRHRSAKGQVDALKTDAMLQACHMLDCDTKLFSCPLAKPFRWSLRNQFPFPAYLHIVQDLRSQPLAQHAVRAWSAMSDNFQARFGFSDFFNNPITNLFNRTTYHAWEALEAVYIEAGEHLVEPQIVTTIKQMLDNVEQEVRSTDKATADGCPISDIDTCQLLMSFGYEMLDDETVDSMGSPFDFFEGFNF